MTNLPSSRIYRGISAQQQKEQPRHSGNQNGKHVEKRKTSAKSSTPLSVQPVQNTKPKQKNSPNLQQLIGHKNQNYLAKKIKQSLRGFTQTFGYVMPFSWLIVTHNSCKSLDGIIVKITLFWIITPNTGNYAK